MLNTCIWAWGCSQCFMHFWAWGHSLCFMHFGPEVAVMYTYTWARGHSLCTYIYILGPRPQFIIQINRLFIIQEREYSYPYFLCSVQLLVTILGDSYQFSYQLLAQLSIISYQFSYQISVQLSVIISVSVSIVIISVINYWFSDISLVSAFIILSFSCLTYYWHPFLPEACISQCR